VTVSIKGCDRTPCANDVSFAVGDLTKSSDRKVNGMYESPFFAALRTAGGRSAVMEMTTVRRLLVPWVQVNNECERMVETTMSGLRMYVDDILTM
jgi:hypothetical protein